MTLFGKSQGKSRGGLENFEERAAARETVMERTTTAGKLLELVKNRACGAVRRRFLLE